MTAGMAEILTATSVAAAPARGGAGSLRAEKRGGGFARWLCLLTAALCIGAVCLLAAVCT